MIITLGQAVSDTFVVAGVDMEVGFEFTNDTYLGSYSDPVIYLDVIVHAIHYDPLPGYVGVSPLDLSSQLRDEVVDEIIEEIKSRYVNGLYSLVE